MIIIISFGENIVFGLICIDRCVSISDLHGLPCISLYSSWKRKLTRTWPIVKSNSTSYWSKNIFTRINNKNSYEMRGVGAIHFFRKCVLYRIVVLTDIIAIFITPGIFSPVLNNIGPIASKQAHFYFLQAPWKTVILPLKTYLLLQFSTSGAEANGIL